MNFEHFPFPAEPVNTRDRDPLLPRRHAAKLCTAGDGKMDSLYRKDRAMSDGDVIDTADFKAVYRNSIVKRFARDLAASMSTARSMIYGGVWPSRRREAALVLAEQIKREKAALALVEAKVARILEEYEGHDSARTSNNENRASISSIGKVDDRSGAVLVQPERTHHPQYPNTHKAGE